MTPSENDLDGTLVIERSRWQNGPPHELFKQLRSECPVHWSAEIPDFPDQDGFWSVTTARTSIRSAAIGRRSPPNGAGSRP